MILDFLTPEMKGAIKTIVALIGVESGFGAVSNKIVRYQSVAVAAGSKVFRALATISNGVANVFERVNDLGGKVTTEIKENDAGKVDN